MKLIKVLEIRILDTKKNSSEEKKVLLDWLKLLTNIKKKVYI